METLDMMTWNGSYKLPGTANEVIVIPRRSTQPPSRMCFRMRGSSRSRCDSVTTPWARTNHNTLPSTEAIREQIKSNCRSHGDAETRRDRSRHTVVEVLAEPCALPGFCGSLRLFFEVADYAVAVRSPVAARRVRAA